MCRICEGCDLELRIDSVGRPAACIGTWEAVRKYGGSLATTKQGQRIVVRFLFSGGVKPIEIHCRIRI